MAECKQAYDSGDYQRFIDIGVEDPNTGAPLVAAIHNEGQGATLITNDKIPEGATQPETLSDTIASIQPNIENAAGALMNAYKSFIGNEQISKAINKIDLFNTGAQDAQSISDAMETIQAAIEERMQNPDLDAADISHLQQTEAILRDTHSNLREVIETDSSFAVLNDIDRGLKSDFGFSEPEAEKALKSGGPEMNVSENDPVLSMENTKIKP